jgi:serine/threonine-protein phosphatase 6 regulatory ankyrin repeat subunit B
MREGDVGDDMFILSSGEVEIVIGEEGTVVARLGPGKFFGELALLKNAKRNATVRAAAPVNDPNSDGFVTEAARLSKEAFDQVVKQNPGVLDQITAVAFGRDRAKEVVRKVPIFKDCDDTFLDLLVRKLKPEVLKEVDFVMREGDTGSEMYILYKGEVEVIAGAENKVLAKLGEGAFFGEIALLKNARRNASIRALTQCETFVLNKEDFDSALADYPDYREMILAVANEKAARREESLLPLHLAVRSGNIAEVDRVIKEHIGKNTEKEQVNIKDEVGWSSLHEAAHSGFHEVVEHLIKLGANVDEMNKEGSTPLHLAASSGHVEATDALITAGANLKAMNEDGSTPLHLAGRCGEIEVARKILDRGGKVETVDVNGNIPLHLASNVGHAEMVRFLIKAGSDVNAANLKGVVPLHDAALSDSGEVVKVLTEHGATVDKPDDELATPLQYAGNNGSTEAARELCLKKAQCGFRDYNGHIPLHHAAFDGTRSCVEVLLEYGSNIRCKGEDGNVPYMFAQMAGNEEIAELLYFEEDPLIIAVREGDYDMVQSLIDGGSDVNGFHAEDGWTAMHEASARGDAAMLAYLAENGGKINVQSVDGMTPLHMATGGAAADATETLLDLGAAQDPDKGVNGFIDSRNAVGRTALHIAAKSGDPDLVALLISSGADIDAVDSYGNTAEHYAKKSGTVPWAEMLQYAPNPSILEACRASDMVMLRSEIKKVEETDDAEHTKMEAELSRLVTSAEAESNAEVPEAERMPAASWCAHYGWAEGLAAVIAAGGGKVHGGGGLAGYRPLHMAVRGADDEHAECVEALVDAGCDVNAATDDGCGPVICHVTPVDASERSVRALARGGADLDARNESSGDTLLHEAALRGEAGLVKALIDLGASPRVKNVSGLNAYDLALQSDDPQAITWMLADPHGACRDDDRVALKTVLENQTVEPDLLVAGDDKLQTPLHVAAETGSVGCAKVLLEAMDKLPRAEGSEMERAEANINAYDNQGLTPLHQAVISGSAEVVTLLISRGADPNTVTGEGELKPDGTRAPAGCTALHLAAIENKPECVHALFGGEVTPHPDAADPENRTALEAAEAEGSEEAAAAIRECLASNITPEEASALLLAAAKRGDGTAVARAIAKGADTTGRGSWDGGARWGLWFFLGFFWVIWGVLVFASVLLIYIFFFP